MLLNAVLAIGLAATVVAGAPVDTTLVPKEEVSVAHTVMVDDSPMPTPTVNENVVGAGVGYGPAPAETAEAATTPSVDASAAAAPPSSPEAPFAAAPMEVPPSSTNAQQPVAPVVPVHICTNKGTRCLTTVGSEFADTKLSFDNVATFSLGLDGLLVRLNDNKCVNAVPMDDATWYDLAYVSCTLPNYLQGALELGAADATGHGTAEAKDRSAATQEHNTIWSYDTKTSYLCANVNDGLNDIIKVCMYSDEGYAMLGTKEELKSVQSKSRQVTMPVAQKDDTSMSEQLAQMLKAMTYDGSVFWANAYDTNIETVMKYRMIPKEQDINMGRDDITGIVWPLWQVINDCRTTCDIYAWCRSFTFHIHERVCTLSSNQPTVDPNELDSEDPDMVTFSQNSNYNREDFVLPEDIKTDVPKNRRRFVRSA